MSWVLLFYRPPNMTAGLCRFYADKVFDHGAFVLKQGFIFILFLIFFTAAHSGADEIQKYDIVFKNGMVVDGSGLPPYRTDVAVAHGKIVKIGNLGVYQADQEVDAKGLVVSPGFIDILRHNDLLWSFSEQKRAIEE